MSKNNKEEKLQVLLSADDFQKLKNIIINKSSERGQLLSTSAYIRELITNHIKNYDGIQTSYADNQIKQIINQTKFPNK